MRGWFQRVDPRWYVVGNHVVLVGVGVAFLGLQRDWLQVAFCVGLGCATELAAAAVFKKHPSLRIRDRLLSANVACWGALVLIRSNDWWFYGVVVSIGLLSKYVLVNEKGRHFFNPLDFAVVFSLAFAPDHLFVRTDQFSSDEATFFLLLPVVLAFGLLAAIRAKRWRQTLAYYAIVGLVGVPVGMALGVKWLWVLAPELNTSTLIFAFLMITDPRTSPEAPRSQWVFAGAVTLLHLLLRYEQVPYSPFVALFGVTGLWSVVGPLFERRPAPAAASA